VTPDQQRALKRWPMFGATATLMHAHGFTDQLIAGLMLRIPNCGARHRKKIDEETIKLGLS
jgi:hypothetical protein